MKILRILSLLLSLTLLLGMLPAASAANYSFSDISDNRTAQNAEILRMMGILDGMGDGTFRPDSILTRAQFCKMAIAAMGQSDVVAQYRNYTIFPDVRGSHWASGYINLAVRGETRLLTGYPNGTFAPDDPVTFAQAVTILMRLLGHTDETVGVAWPDGYLNTAASVGLTKDLPLSAGSPLTRAQAAQLFVNLLDTPKAGSSARYISAISGIFWKM